MQKKKEILAPENNGGKRAIPQWAKKRIKDVSCQKREDIHAGILRKEKKKKLRDGPRKKGEDKHAGGRQKKKKKPIPPSRNGRARRPQKGPSSCSFKKEEAKKRQVNAPYSKLMKLDLHRDQKKGSDRLLRDRERGKYSSCLKETDWREKEQQKNVIPKRRSAFDVIAENSDQGKKEGRGRRILPKRRKEIRQVSKRSERDTPAKRGRNRVQHHISKRDRSIVDNDETKKKGLVVGNEAERRGPIVIQRQKKWRKTNRSLMERRRGKRGSPRALQLRKKDRISLDSRSSQKRPEKGHTLQKRGKRKEPRRDWLFPKAQKSCSEMGERKPRKEAPELKKDKDIHIHAKEGKTKKRSEKIKKLLL